MKIPQEQVPELDAEGVEEWPDLEDEFGDDAAALDAAAELRDDAVEVARQDRLLLSRLAHLRHVVRVTLNWNRGCTASRARLREPLVASLAVWLTHPSPYSTYLTCLSNHCRLPESVLGTTSHWVWS